MHPHFERECAITAQRLAALLVIGVLGGSSSGFDGPRMWLDDESEISYGIPADTGDAPQNLDPSANGAAGGQSAAINGVYSLNLEDCSPQMLEPYLLNQDLDGFSLRAKWYEIEIMNNVYDWSVFDTVVAQAAEHGKKVMLRVLPGIYSPNWLYAVGAVPFSYVDDNPNHPTYGQVVTMPVPWDPVFRSQWLSVVAKLGQRYSGCPAVKIVAITGPAAGGEMHLGDKDNAAAWHAVGYSNAVLMGAWTVTIDAFVAAFPHQHLSLAVSNPVSFDDPDEVRYAVGTYCAQTGCGLQGNWLTAATPPESELYQQVASHAAYAPVGFQMLCSATQQDRFGGPLTAAIDLALSAHASFVEVYRTDVTAFPDEIAYAHERLAGGGDQVAE